MKPHRSRHMFWDHLAFWFVIGLTICFMIFDAYRMLTGTGLIEPPEIVEQEE